MTENDFVTLFGNYRGTFFSPGGPGSLFSLSVVFKAALSLSLSLRCDGEWYSSYEPPLCRLDLEPPNLNS